MAMCSIDISDKVPFLHLCELFERMSVSKSAKSRKVLLHKLVDQYVGLTKNYYPILRLMAPEADLKRVYGIREKTLATIILETYSIAEKSEDGKRLLKWKEGEGNLPAIIYSLALARSTAKSRWTLQDVNTFLDELALNKGMDSKKRVFRQVVSKLHAREVKWLCKIILKKLRYGTSLPVLLEAFCPRSSELFAFQADLQHVCKAIEDPTFNIEEAMELKLFIPFQPMLSSRRKPLDIPNTMDPPYFVETKYDGERVLIHIQKKKTRIFSRYLQDSTSLYSNLIREVRRSLNKTVKSCILDGELLVWDEEKHTIEPFGGARAVATAGIKEDSKHFFLKIFDVLHYNSNDLLDHALYERKEILHNIITEIPTHVEIVKHIEYNKIEEVVYLFRKAAAAKEEGVVVKNPRSPYLPNVRNNKAWVKLKPDFVSNIASDLDVLILGGYYGEGVKSGGKLYSYLVGVQNNDGTEYYPVGKVATGLSERERDYLLEELEDDWVAECPVNVIPGSDVPDMWIDPEDSRVLEVRAMQIIPCDKRLVGVTFRCPRIEKIRYDKDPEGIITLERLQNLIREAPEMKESGMRSKPSPPRRAKVYTPLTLPTDTSRVETISDLFQGKVFYICGHAWEKDKRKELETIIHKYGGIFHQNYGPQVTHIVAEKSTVQLKRLIEEAARRCQLTKKSIDYEKLRVCDLKVHLKERRLKTTGRKLELIERLQHYDTSVKPLYVVKVDWLTQSIEQETCLEVKEDNCW